MDRDGVRVGLPPRGAVPRTQALSTRPGGRSAKRVKLRAREHARLQCENLELDIMNLRQEIATLTNLRQLLSERTLNRADAPHGIGRFERVVREYYALTAKGYYDVVWRKPKRGTTTEPVEMVQFMRSCFDESLAIGDQTAPPTAHGRNDFVYMLGEMMAMADAVNVKILEAHVRPGDAKHHTVVEYQTRCASSLTRLLLDSLFPHLKVSYPWLQDKLVGKKVVSLAKGTFVFDTRSGLVVRVDLRIDNVTSVLKLAESIEELQILKNEPPSSWGRAMDVAACKHGVDETELAASDRSRASRSTMSLRHVHAPTRAYDDRESRAAIA